MDRQQSFFDIAYKNKKKRTRKEIFLSEMERLVPWKTWCDMIKPYYPKGDNGRKPIPIEIMLRMYFVQLWFNLSDELTEDSIYDVCSIRQFVGIPLGLEDAPDATTLLRFRHLLEEHGLTKKMFDNLTELLKAEGFMMKEGTIVDATIVNAPSSTKNKDKKRDPEMHSTKKGSNYYFGMKTHIGVDAKNGLIHSVETTPANESDISKTEDLLHGEETTVYGDAGYVGVEKREEFSEKKDENGVIIKEKSTIDFQINKRKSTVKNMPEGREKEEAKAAEKAKSSVRAKVEFGFHVIKDLFHYRKVNYKGIEKKYSKNYNVSRTCKYLHLQDETAWFLSRKSVCPIHGGIPPIRRNEVN